MTKSIMTYESLREKLEELDESLSAYHGDLWEQLSEAAGQEVASDSVLGSLLRAYLLSSKSQEIMWDVITEMDLINNEPEFDNVEPTDDAVPTEQGESRD